MYSEISNVFLNNIRAIKFYVNSVDQNMGKPFIETVVNNTDIDKIIAAMIYQIASLKEKEMKISDILRSREDIPEEIIEYIKQMESLVDEMESDSENLPILNYLPRAIRKEYRNFEARERQKEILYRGSLLLIVTYFENLIAGVLRENFVKYPQRIALNEKSVSYKVLTEVNDIEEIKDILIDQEVTNKMYESLIDWKNYFQKNIKLNLNAWEEEFDALQEIMARRNLYVHNNGIINNIYVKLVKDVNKDFIGEYLNIDREYIDNAINTIEYIGMSLVIEIWLKEYSGNQDEIDNIINMIYEEYLEQQRWKMARNFYELCLQSPKIKDADRIVCKINNWQCYKWLNEYDKVRDEVDNLDISAYKPRYILGVLVLKEDYEKFFEFYDNQNDIDENALKEWPLFAELRKSEEYRRRFPEVKIEEKKEIELKKK